MDPEDSDKEKKSIRRTRKFVLFLQIEGLCEALRIEAQFRTAPGAGTARVTMTLRQHFLKVVSGLAAEVVPPVSRHPTTGEPLTIAEVRRATMVAFLPPDEFDEQRQSIGSRI